VNGITGNYLASFQQPPRVQDTALMRARFRGRYLARPLFLERGELLRLWQDLDVVHSSLTNLPQLLFDGDITEFAKELAKLLARSASDRLAAR
jgi:hypothetical protein